MVQTQQRRQFDKLLDQVVESLPPRLCELLQQIPLIVEDEPSGQLLARLGLDRRSDNLCGLHWGVPLTQRSVEMSAHLPDQMNLFRGPIMRVVGCFGQTGTSMPTTQRERLQEQIRITLLHEIGHHFGLNEEDLAKLGYG